MAIILQLTESEKNALVLCYLDQKTNVDHILTYNSKSIVSHKGYLKSYISNQYITVEGISLSIVGPPRQVYLFYLKYLILFKAI